MIVDSRIPVNTALFGDVARAMLVYRKEGIVAESSRDAEFALDNTRFRFRWRFDVAVVENGEINHYPES